MIEDRDPLGRLLLRLKRWVACYPGVAAATFQALVAEGRAFAATPDGQRTQAALARSDLVRRGRLVWDACGLDALLADRPPGLLPSRWLELALATLATADLEGFLSRSIAEVVNDEDLDRA